MISEPCTNVIVVYENPETHVEYTQALIFTEKQANMIYAELDEYEGGGIKPDSALFNLFTGLKYISKIQGFKETPNFTIMPREVSSELEEEAHKKVRGSWS